MFNIESYFSRIGYSGPAKPTLDTLRALQKRHLMSIPFDNTLNADEQRGVEVLSDVDIDVDAIFAELIEGGRGGVCYETNGLLRRLLTELEFDVRILAGSVLQVNGGFGPDMEHIFNCVQLDGDIWLVDVGLAGPSYLEPLRLTDEVQRQYGVDYRIVDDEDDYHQVQRKSLGADWSPIYRFKLDYHAITDWQDIVASLADFPLEVSLVGTRIHSRAFDNGQWVLIGKRYLKVEDGKEEIRVLAKPERYQEVVDVILNGAS